MGWRKCSKLEGDGYASLIHWRQLNYMCKGENFVVCEFHLDKTFFIKNQRDRKYKKDTE